MNYYRDDWLPHLEGSIPAEARRNRVSLYTIALEGWRRGLRLKFYQRKDDHNRHRLIYSLQSEKKIHYFNESSGDKNTDEAFEICGDKGLTNKFLEEANVPIPSGKFFDKNSTVDDIIKDAEILGYPLVVKPTDGNSGKGVIANIENKKELKNAICHVREKLSFENLIVQQHVNGDEVRIYVLGDKVLAAANRLPANIIGDGQSSIVKLIEYKNEFRKQIPHLNYRPIKVDTEVRNLINDAGYTLDSILKKGERLFLRKISNVSTGGDPIDVTDKLTEKQKKIAVDATRAIPGLTHCGVDMIIDEKSGDGVILELNTRPGIGSHLFPIEGKARDIPKAIIDYYFPETKEKKDNCSNAYFDLQIVFDTLNGGYLSEIEMKRHPLTTLHATKLEITGELDVLSYYTRLKKYFIQRQFNGYMKQHDNETIEIVVGHENRTIIDECKQFLRNKRKNLQIHNITESKWDQPLKIGFDLIDGLNQLSLAELENEYKQSYKDNRTLEMELRRLNKRIELMKTSRAWRLTAPIRFVKDVLNRLK